MINSNSGVILMQLAEEIDYMKNELDIRLPKNSHQELRDYYARRIEHLEEVFNRMISRVYDFETAESKAASEKREEALYDPTVTCIKRLEDDVLYSPRTFVVPEEELKGIAEKSGDYTPSEFLLDYLAKISERYSDFVNEMRDPGKSYDDRLNARRQLENITSGVAYASKTVYESVMRAQRISLTPDVDLPITAKMKNVLGDGNWNQIIEATKSNFDGVIAALKEYVSLEHIDVNHIRTMESDINNGANISGFVKLSDDPRFEIPHPETEVEAEGQEPDVPDGPNEPDEPDESEEPKELDGDFDLAEELGGTDGAVPVDAIINDDGLEEGVSIESTAEDDPFYVNTDTLAAEDDPLDINEEGRSVEELFREEPEATEAPKETIVGNSENASRIARDLDGRIKEITEAIYTIAADNKLTISKVGRTYTEEAEFLVNSVEAAAKYLEFDTGDTDYERYNILIEEKRDRNYAILIAEDERLARAIAKDGEAIAEFSATKITLDENIKADILNAVKALEELGFLPGDGEMLEDGALDRTLTAERTFYDGYYKARIELEKAVAGVDYRAFERLGAELETEARKLDKLISKFVAPEHEPVKFDAFVSKSANTAISERSISPIFKFDAAKTALIDGAYKTALLARKYGISVDELLADPSGKISEMLKSADAAILDVKGEKGQPKDELWKLGTLKIKTDPVITSGVMSDLISFYASAHTDVNYVRQNLTAAVYLNGLCDAVNENMKTAVEKAEDASKDSKTVTALMLGKGASEALTSTLSLKDTSTLKTAETVDFVTAFAANVVDVVDVASNIKSFFEAYLYGADISDLNEVVECARSIAEAAYFLADPSSDEMARFELVRIHDYPEEYLKGIKGFILDYKLPKDSLALTQKENKYLASLKKESKLESARTKLYREEDAFNAKVRALEDTLAKTDPQYIYGGSRTGQEHIETVARHEEANAQLKALKDSHEKMLDTALEDGIITNLYRQERLKNIAAGRLDDKVNLYVKGKARGDETPSEKRRATVASLFAKEHGVEHLRNNEAVAGTQRYVSIELEKSMQEDPFEELDPIKHGIPTAPKSAAAKEALRQAAELDTEIGTEFSKFVKEDARFAEELNELFNAGEDAKEKFGEKQAEHSEFLDKALKDGVITEHYSTSRRINIMEYKFFKFPSLHTDGLSYIDPRRNGQTFVYGDSRFANDIELHEEEQSIKIDEGRARLNATAEKAPEPIASVDEGVAMDLSEYFRASRPASVQTTPETDKKLAKENPEIEVPGSDML